MRSRRPLPKYTLYLSDQPSHSDTLTLSERGGDPVTVIGSPCHSGPQKRIEKESNKKLTNELAELVGESFEEAAKPRALEVPSVSPAVSETGVFDKFWSAYPNCIYKKPNAKARCCAPQIDIRRIYCFCASTVRSRFGAGRFKGGDCRHTSDGFGIILDKLQSHNWQRNINHGT